MRFHALQSLMLVVALTAPAAAQVAAQVEQKPPTADKQSQSKADIAMTQQIRRALLKNKSLSLKAHNCKVITQQGLVTLRGEVTSDAERATVGDTASQIAGAGHVTNLLTVKVKK